MVVSSQMLSFSTSNENQPFLARHDNRPEYLILTIECVAFTRLVSPTWDVSETFEGVPFSNKTKHL